MSDFSPKLTDKAAEGVRPMNAACEARDLISRIAGPQELGHSIKSALRDVARKTGLGDRRVRSLWNREARAILSDEMDRLRTVPALEEARHEARKITASIRRADAALVSATHGDRSLDHDAGTQVRLAHRSLAPGE